MLLLWIGGLIFIGAGLAAVFRGLRGLETQFESSLFIGGLILISCGLVIGTLGLVIRQLHSVRDVLETGVERPGAAIAETVPVIATATMERPSPAASIKRNARSSREGGSGGAGVDAARPDAARDIGQSHLPVQSPDTRQALAVIRSGTVNNMDYELRGDGTIVVTLSDQTFEFRSIDELRRYLAALSQGGHAESR